MKNICSITAIFVTVFLLSFSYYCGGEEENDVIIWKDDANGDVYGFRMHYDLNSNTYEVWDFEKRGFKNETGYHLTSYHVLPNQTLEIQSGTKVYFENDYGNAEQFMIWGLVECKGKKDDMVLFSTKSNDSVEILDGFWNGIYLFNESKGVSSFDYTIFERAGYFFVENDIRIRNSIFNRSEGVGTKVFSNFDLFEMSNCSFTSFNSDELEDEDDGFWYLNPRISINGVENVTITDSTMNVEFMSIMLNGSNQLLFHNNIVNMGDHVAFENANLRSEVSNNKIRSSSMIIGKNIDFKSNSVDSKIRLQNDPSIVGNTINGTLEIDMMNFNGFVRNNNFNVDIDYFLIHQIEYKGMELSYNSWGRDFYLEEIFEPDDEYNVSVYVDFEPYYDMNGTLTDDDRMPNGWEVFWGLDMYSNDSHLDSDNDGLTNLEEFQNGGDYKGGGCNPFDDDTDDDGMPDGWEVENGLDPLVNDSKLDSDNDGYDNLREFIDDTDPNKKTSPDPTSENSDDHKEKWYHFGIPFGIIIILIVVIITVIYRKKDNNKIEE